MVTVKKGMLKLSQPSFPPDDCFPGPFHSGDGGKYSILSRARTGVRDFLKWMSNCLFIYGAWCQEPASRIITHLKFKTVMDLGNVSSSFVL